MDMLPASLGAAPFVVSTAEKPYIFVAFYATTCHEMADGTVIDGNEFRLWQPSTGFKRLSAPLAGIIGIRQGDCLPVLHALTDQATRGRDLKPYGPVLREIMSHWASDKIGEWDPADAAS
jgi:hypothetical protein